MPVKIRLRRQGRKKTSYYHIIVADSRAPRDGRFIDKLGIYNPNTNPATIELDFSSALDWVLRGAQPTDTCRAILSYKGVMYKKHLLEGVRKKAFSEEEAETRFNSWLKQKEEKIQSKRDFVEKSKDDLNKKRLEAEARVNEKRAEEIAKKLARLAAKEAEEKGTTEAAEDKAAEEISDTASSKGTTETAENTETPADTHSEEKKPGESEA